MGGVRATMDVRFILGETSLIAVPQQSVVKSLAMFHVRHVRVTCRCIVSCARACLETWSSESGCKAMHVVQLCKQIQHGWRFWIDEVFNTQKNTSPMVLMP